MVATSLSELVGAGLGWAFPGMPVNSSGSSSTTRIRPVGVLGRTAASFDAAQRRDATTTAGPQSSRIPLNASGASCSLRWTAIARTCRVAQNATTTAAQGSPSSPTRSPGRTPQSWSVAARARLRRSRSAKVRRSFAKPTASLPGNRPAISCSRSCSSIGSSDRASLRDVAGHGVERPKILGHELFSLDRDLERLLQPNDEIDHGQAVEHPVGHEVLGGIELQLRIRIQHGPDVLKDLLLRGHAVLQFWER